MVFNTQYSFSPEGWSVDYKFLFVCFASETQMTQISTLVLEVVSNPRLVFFTKGVILIQLIQSCRELNSRSSSFLQKIINVLPVYFCKVLAACKPMWTMCLSKIRLVKKKISVNSFYCRLYLAFASLVAQLVNKKIKKKCRRPWFDSWVRRFPWRSGRLPTPVFLNFPGGSDGKESIHNVGDLRSIPGLGRFPPRRAWQPTPIFLPRESPWTEEPGGL